MTKSLFFTSIDNGDIISLIKIELFDNIPIKQTVFQ